MDWIDSHQHYWDIGSAFQVDNLPWVMGAVTYAWKQAGLDQLDRPFLPRDLTPQLADHDVTHTIVVNVIHSMGETRWLLDLAAGNPSIAGVVGWISLTQPRELVERDLDVFAHEPKLVGVRHLAQFEPDERWLLRSDVLGGLAAIADRDLSFDLLLQPQHLPCVPFISEKVPGLRMVIDHIAKPRIREGELEPWATHIREAAVNPNVFCKISGMITEASHEGWKPEDLTPYVAIAVEAFGTDRLMFGSDWPVCTLAGSYADVMSSCRFALQQSVGPLTNELERALFRDNAARFYKLDQAAATRGPR